MYTKTYKYQDDKNQTYWFRGYVYWYEGATKVKASCIEVRKTRAEAEKDAKKLLTQLKKDHANRPKL